MVASSKRGQIVGLANLRGDQRLSLKEIVNETNVPLSTCSDIIRFSTLRISETNIPDPCSEDNLRPRPTVIKGQNQALSAEEKARVIAIALQDALHCLIRSQTFYPLMVSTAATLQRSPS
ncbi:hypothetical protein B9Z19DRAFT_1060955 [Tuber borchii]|uniref:Uncharacterized protein n=1 Tax=Tuber borchii TaxID=42251 RepID=A0A2T7A6W8_TUBBO|nr:hypothetical protein B9Z19DRAFT_1060955 [Tuber borchii]